MKLSGTYYITLFEDRTINILGEFTSKFQEKYPGKASCISSSSFSNAVYEKNKPYLIVITTEKGLSFGTSFCVSNRNSNNAIQDFTIGKCEDKKESLWERFLKFIDIN